MSIERALIGTTDTTASAAVYVENVFSTYLYTGTGASQTITNGIDLATKGGMVWLKGSSGATDHALYDTARGATYDLTSTSTAAQTTQSTGLTAFGTTGFTIGALAKLNTSAATYASWTFRKQAKFFDVQTKSHTNGTSSTVDLSTLGTVGMVIVKRTDSTSGWYAWHRSLTSGNNILLNTTAAQSTTSAYLSVSGTTLTLSSSTPTGTYVVYAFAHDAGGFGAAGTDSVVSCGSFVGSTANITLGWEPQFVIIKRTESTGSWWMLDNMRGVATGGDDKYLFAESSGAEGSLDAVDFTSTGFTQHLSTSGITNFIYLAIRKNMQ